MVECVPQKLVAMTTVVCRWFVGAAQIAVRERSSDEHDGYLAWVTKYIPQIVIGYGEDRRRWVPTNRIMSVSRSKEYRDIPMQERWPSPNQ